MICGSKLTSWVSDTIITAFPRRWGRNKPDPSAVHRAIRDYMASVDKGQINSIYDLALIIVDECSKVIFDRTKPDLRPEVVDIFGSAISKIVRLMYPLLRTMALLTLGTLGGKEDGVIRAVRP